MRRRTFTTLTLTLVVAALLAWLPTAPPVRDRLADVLIGAAASAGYTVTFGELGGYLWRGAQLHDLHVTGAGVELVAERATVRWFLPGLVVGELPVRIDLQGLRGDLALARLALPEVTSSGAGPRLRWDDVRVSGGHLRVAEIPFDLPDLTVDRLAIATDADGSWRANLTLSTTEGALAGELRGRLGDAGVDVVLERADATLARHWWDGARGGLIRGEGRWSGIGMDGRFELVDGALEAFGIDVVGVTGPIDWRGDTLEAAWTGRALGGTVEARGLVDLAAPRWEAEGEVEADLVEASAALLALVGAPALPGASGAVRGSVRVSGWTDVDLRAEGSAAGAWLGSDLDLADVRAGYDSRTGLSLAVDGTWGTGAARVAAAPAAAGIGWRVEVGPVDVVGIPLVELTASLSTGGGPPTGRIAARAADGPWSLSADVALDADGVRAFVEGSAWEGTIVGALAAPAALAAAPLDGSIAWRPPTGWTDRPALVTAAVAGTVGEPSARLTVEADGPLRPGPDADRVAGTALSVLFPDVDLRGALDVAWPAAGPLLTGRLGPASLAWSADGWTASLTAVALGGPVAGRLGPAEARGSATGWTATAATELAVAAAAPGVEAPWLAWPGVQTWAASGDADGWRVVSGGGAWTIAATVGTTDPGPLLTARSAAIELVGVAGTLDAEGTLAAGSARWRSGVADLTADWRDGAIEGALATGERRLTWSWRADEGAAAAGDLDVGALAATWAGVAGVAAEASLEARWRPGTDALPTGRATVTLAGPVGAIADLRADGAGVDWNAAGDLLGRPWSSVGRWDPGSAAAIDGTWSWDDLATLALGPSGAHGAGAWPGAQVLGIEVPAQAWSLSASLDGRATFAFGASRAELTLDGGARIDGVVDLSAQWAGRPAHLSGSVVWSEANPDGAFTLDARLPDGATARVEGSMSGASATVAGPVAAWAEALAPFLGAAGEAALAGDLSGRAQWSPAGGLTADATWRDRLGGDVVAAWDAAGLEVRGSGWTARASPAGDIRWRSSGADVAGLLRRDDVALVLDGEFAWPRGGTSTGSLTASISTPFGQAEATATGGSLPRVVARAGSSGWLAEADGTLALDPGPLWSGRWRLDADTGAPLPIGGEGAFELGPAGAAAQGELRLPAGAAGPLAWPDLAARVGVAAAEPLAISISGTTGLRGAWPDGLSADVVLAGEPARVTLRPEGARLAVTVRSDAYDVDLLGTPDAWSGRASARAGAAALDVEAAGRGLEAAGSWRLRGAAGAWAGGGFSLSDGVVEATLAGADLDVGNLMADVAGLDDERFAVGPAAGMLAARWSSAGVALEGDVAVQAVAAGTPLLVRAAFAGRAGQIVVDLGEDAAIGRWGLRVDDLAVWPDLRVDVEGEALGLGWSGAFQGADDGVRGSLRGGDAWTLAVAGGRDGRAEIAGPGDAHAELRWASAGGFAAELRGVAAGVALSAAWDAAHAGAGGAVLRLEATQVDSERSVALAGTVAPLDLRGSARLADEAYPLRLFTDTGPTLTWGGLQVTWLDGALRLRGDSAAGQLPHVALHDADLRWSPEAGWGGAASASGAWPPAGLRWQADLAGDGSLRVVARGDVGGVPVGTVQGAWAADPRDGVAGAADLSLPVPIGADAMLRAHGDWAFDADGLRADLALDFSGPVAAAGRLTAVGVDVAARLDGTGLAAEALVRSGVVDATLAVRDLPLDTELPWLLMPRLSGDASARWAAGGLSWRVDEAILASASSTVVATVVGSPDGAMEATGHVDVDLADLRLADPWRGTVRGSVSFAGSVDAPVDGAIAAGLDVEGVRWGPLDATWGGRLTATGTAGDPMLRAAWRADGARAALSGEASWRPAHEAVALRASGDVAEVDVDVDLALGEAGFAGSGHVAWNGVRWLLAADAGRLHASGVGAWSASRAALDPDGWFVTLDLDLSALAPLDGSVHGRIDLGTAPPLRTDLHVRGLTAAGIALGDVVVEGDLDRGWTAAGALLSASLAADASTWSVDVEGATAGIGDTLLAASLTSDGNGLRARARWEGTTPAGGVDLRLDATAAADAWRGRIHGAALGGDLDLPLARGAGGWTGAGTLAGADAGGVPLRAVIDVHGDELVPELDVRFIAGDRDGWSGEVGWSAGAARVDLRVPLPDGRTVTARGNAWPAVDLVLDGGDAGWVRATAGWTTAPLRLDGSLDLDLQGFRLELHGPSTVRVRVPALEGGLRATLPAAPLPEAVAQIRREGWRWIGVDGWEGTVRIAREGGPWLETDDLRLAPGDVRIALRATVDGRGSGIVGTASAEIDVAAAATGLGPGPWTEPLRLDLAWDGRDLRATGSAPWGLDLVVTPEDRRAVLRAEVASVAGGEAVLSGEVRLIETRWSGGLRWRTTTGLLGDDPATVEVALTGEGDHLAIAGVLRGPRGSLTANGRWDAADLLPGGWGPPGPGTRALDLRVVGLDLAGFAGAAAVSGTVTGSASLRGDQVFGRLTSEDLVLGGRRDRAVLDVRVDLSPEGPRAEGHLDLTGWNLQVEADRSGATAFLRMERYPAHELLAAAVGPSDVTADVTGAARIGWTWGARVPNDVRVVGEKIVLERAGVVTEGELAMTWDGESLTFGRTVFAGRGTWQVRGSATPAALDLELEALDADFGPLLGLVPAFALNGVSAQGDLTLRASGTPSAPDVVVRTDDLEVLVSGTRYRLEGLNLALRGAAWSGQADLVGLSPITGRVAVVSEGRIGPWPDEGFALSARAVGDLDVPYLGRVADLDAELAWSDRAPATLQATGRLDAPFAVTGTLAPLDLRATGRDLRVTVPFLAVADAVLDADLRLIADADGPRLSGRLDAAQARVDLAVRASTTDPAPAPTARATAAPLPTPPVDPRTRFRFDGVRLVAPQRVTFAETFGNAEAGLDLTLDGTLADPRLSGTIRAVRGTVRFAGRDLELTEALASFDPTRGVYPAVRVAGRTSFEKARVVAPGDAVRFLAPAGPRFTVDLLLEGEAVGGASGFALDLRPTLTSDALVEGLGGTGPRTPSELELLTLLTLGRLEATTGVAGAVAQSALDAAVDLLVTGELQAALSEALGVEVVELRTTTVSSLIDGADPFGVSLRLGGYLSDEIFASYRVSTLGGDAFSNEVALAYQLGPVAVDVTGRFDVAAGAVAARGPSLALGARYGFAPGIALEFGVDLSSERSTARLGVSWRW